MKSTTKTLWEMSMCYVRRKSTVMRTKGRMREEERRNRHERLVFHFGPKDIVEDIVAGNLLEWVFLSSVYFCLLCLNRKRRQTKGRRLIIPFHDNFHSSSPFTLLPLPVLMSCLFDLYLSLCLDLNTFVLPLDSLSVSVFVFVFYLLFLSHEFNLMISFIPFPLCSCVTDHLLFVFIKTLRGT